MKQEEKAKAYDEALEKARMYRDNAIAVEEYAAVARYENIFPELRESEDERIRRTLVEYFGPGVQLDLVRGVPIQKIRDWLEKQKDCIVYRPGHPDPIGKEGVDGMKILEKQKENPKSADSISADCTANAKCGNSWHKVGDSLPESKRLANEVIKYLTGCGYSPVLHDDSNKKHFHIDIPRHEDDFWHSEEYKHCRSVLGEYYMEGDYGGDTYTLYIWRAKKEQKPSEWSEEDEKMLVKLLDSISIGNDYEEMRNWLLPKLKSLRTSWKPSEQDELMKLKYAGTSTKLD